MDKWKTVFSASDLQALEQKINDYYHDTGWMLGDEVDTYHWRVINMNTYKHDENIIRYARKTWQYGYYRRVKNNAIK